MRTCALVLFSIACGSSTPAMTDTQTSDGPAGAAACASTFGSALTNAFGRLDGTVLAIVPPGDEDCAMPNSTHVVLQVTMNGDAYRMVVNVLSTSNQPDVWLYDLDAPLAGPAWSEGWHTDAPLDYVSTLGVAKSQFTLADEATAIARVEDMVPIGSRVSVFATSSGGAQAASAHLIHRNATNRDGAIVVNADTAPHYLLSAFDEQTFP